MCFAQSLFFWRIERQFKRSVHESAMILRKPFRLNCVIFVSVRENCDVSRVRALK